MIKNTKTRALLAACTLAAIPLYGFATYKGVGQTIETDAVIASEDWVDLMELPRSEDFTLHSGRSKQKEAMLSFLRYRNPTVNFCSAGTFDFTSTPVSAAQIGDYLDSTDRQIAIAAPEFAQGAIANADYMADNDNFYKRDQAIVTTCQSGMLGSLINNLFYLIISCLVGFAGLLAYSWAFKVRLADFR